jgi:DNA-binding NarL/FixJ family response regulator
MKRVRILLADDHEVVRQGLHRLLNGQPGWKVVGEAATGREAVEQAKKLKPDVVVLDISMPEMNGLEATQQIVKALPKTEVLILTLHDSEDLVRDVVQAGARGYVLKSDTGRDLVAGINALRQHQPFFTSRVSELVLQRCLRKDGATAKQHPSRTRLAPRELEVVKLLAQGKSNKEVAAALDISVRTAETHRSNIMRKLRLHTVADLVRYAIRHKIVEP